MFYFFSSLKLPTLYLPIHGHGLYRVSSRMQLPCSQLSLRLPSRSEFTHNYHAPLTHTAPLSEQNRFPCIHSSSLTLGKQGSRQGSTRDLPSVFSPQSLPTTRVVSAASTQRQNSQVQSHPHSPSPISCHEMRRVIARLSGIEEGRVHICEFPEKVVSEGGRNQHQEGKASKRA